MTLMVVEMLAHLILFNILNKIHPKNELPESFKKMVPRDSHCEMFFLLTETEFLAPHTTKAYFFSLKDGGAMFCHGG